MADGSIKTAIIVLIIENGIMDYAEMVREVKSMKNALGQNFKLTDYARDEVFMAMVFGSVVYVARNATHLAVFVNSMAHSNLEQDRGIAHVMEREINNIVY